MLAAPSPNGKFHLFFDPFPNRNISTQLCQIRIMLLNVYKMILMLFWTNCSILRPALGSDFTCKVDYRTLAYFNFLYHKINYYKILKILKKFNYTLNSPTSKSNTIILSQTSTISYSTNCCKWSKVWLPFWLPGVKMNILALYKIGLLN